MLFDPTGLSKVVAIRLTTPGNLRGDVGSVQWHAIFVVVLAVIGLHDDRL
ncbi:hypothetical protein G3N94_06400 [Burkholderia sp. Ac-20353]|nr:hypothetical protein [Burkholderia sp. Ac-20353]